MNMQNIMAQAQKMQRDITKKTEEINGMEFIGKSDWIEVIFSGDKKLKKITILKEGNIESDDKEILEDMLLIAINDAFSKIKKETDSKLGMYANMGGMF